ncbi:hypothetical protein CVT25_000376 [Psilocybe cyanescens]|uniref:Uncharacterized protein n=1 Tax=Psilocybe cyanescens TaxID=93625 RepID=A0A409XEU4_PSICY|nr:hypothetical protein CVT25_000376 [Psilocybe cyanescens]
MDFMSSSMDQDSPLGTEYEVENKRRDYVQWQGSQTPCQALNQLIKSSINDPILSKENIRVSRAWQREPSFDQIPGFSLLSTTDRTPSTSTRTPSRASSSKPPSSSRPRPRPSEAKSRPKSSTSDAPSADSPMAIPFLDKTNPAQFLDILKGVSAKVDANAGVRPRGGVIDSLLPSRIEKAKKRTRGGSVGSSADALALQAKKVRVESLRQAQVKDKGKGRAVHVEGQAGQESLPGTSTTSRATPNPVDSWGDSSFMDVDDRDKSMDDVSAAGFLFAQSRPALTKTPSQARMPPPPAPMTKHPTISSSASTSTSVTRLHNSHHEDPKGPSSRTSDRTPKYHPLLLQQASKPTNSNSSVNPSIQSSQQHPLPDTSKQEQQSTAVQTSLDRAPKAEPGKPRPCEPTPPTSTPVSGSQSSRPPALGMRRTHTYPSVGMVPSIQKSGALPTKQKGFKPPLLSSSQPQPQPRAQAAAAALPAANHVHAPVAKGSASAVGLNQQQQQQQQRQYNTTSRAPPAGSSGSMSSDSARGHTSSSSFSTSTSASTSNSNSPASSVPHKPSSARSSGSLAREEAIAKALADAAQAQGQAQTRARTTRAPEPRARAAPAAKPPAPLVEPVSVPVPASPVLPEPTDGDGDSSFGDMSFDMDALEETMRQYD